MMTKEERDDMRSAAQMSVTCKIDGPWEDIVACLDDLDAKDQEIKVTNIHLRAASQLIGMKNKEIEALKAELEMYRMVKNP